MSDEVQPGLRTNCLGVYFLPRDGEDDLCVSLVEHYEIIDPALRYEQRFRTDHIALGIGDEEWGVSASNLFELAEMFLGAGRTALERLPAEET